jgi:hypothetical protein
MSAISRRVGDLKACRRSQGVSAISRHIGDLKALRNGGLTTPWGRVKMKSFKPRTLSRRVIAYKAQLKPRHAHTAEV